VKLWSRRGTDFFPQSAPWLTARPSCSQLLSDFEALLTKRGGEIASYVAFDLLTLEGEDLRLRPLEERRTALSLLVADASGVLFSEAVASSAVLAQRRSAYRLDNMAWVSGPSDAAAHPPLKINSDPPPLHLQRGLAGVPSWLIG